MRRKLFAFAVVAIVSTIAPEIAQAEWTQFQRDEFTGGCVPSCRKNPSVSKMASRCEAYCACVMREGESRFTSAQYEVMERDARDNKETSLLKEFARIYPVCSRRIFSN